MDWEVISDGNEGMHEIGPFFYGHIFAHNSHTFLNAHYYANKLSDGLAVPTQEAIDQYRSGGYSLYATEFNQAWKMRSSTYNSLYYNPTVTYTPWPGMPNMRPNKALVMPSQLLEGSRLNNYIASGDTSGLDVVNLTNNVEMDFYFPQLSEVIATPYNTINDANSGYRAPDVRMGVYLPFYYTDAGVKVTISTSQTAQLQNFANWFSYYRRRELAQKAAISSIVSEVTGVHLGYSAFGSPKTDRSRREPGYDPKTEVGPVTATARENIITNVYQTYAGKGGTPLLRKLNEAGHYFMCVGNDEDDGNIFDIDFGGWDASANSGHTSCPRMQNTEIGHQCQQHYTIMMTDGYWEGSTDAESDKLINVNVAAMDDDEEAYFDNDSDGLNAAGNTSYFDGGAFADSSTNISKAYLTLADIAMYFYENDLDSDSSNNMVPMTNKDLLLLANPAAYPDKVMHQHMKTHVIGFGVKEEGAIATLRPNFLKIFDEDKWSAPTDPSTALAWPGAFHHKNKSTDKVYDLLHTAFNGRGDYFSAFNTAALTRSLSNIFEEIASGSGAIASVSFNSDKIGANTKLYSASYNAESNTGDVESFAISRNTDGSVNISNTPDWSAASLLNNKLGDCGINDSRNIFTFDRANKDEIPFTYAAINAQSISGLNEAQVKWIRGSKDDEARATLVGAVITSAAACNGSSRTLRSRSDTNTVMGDIVQARPLYVGPPYFEKRSGSTYPQSSYAYNTFKNNNASRTAMIMVSTNAGVFHALDTTGNELFAYVPHQLITGTGANAIAETTDINYQHKYYINASPAVNDVFFHSDNSWRTVVLGGYGAGGKGYFALDVTSPAGLAAAGNAADDENATDSGLVLGEFTVEDLPYDLGYTYSPPLMTMVNDALTTNKGHRWAAIFGNGYNSVNGNASLVILDMDSFSNNNWTASEKLVITPTDAGIPAGSTEKNGLSTPRGVDINSDGITDYVYAGDLYGNVYRFDLTDMSAITSTLVFTAKNDSNEKQPITTQPYVVPHPQDAGKYLIVVTTGRWLTYSDHNSTSIQSIYGFEDNLTSTGTVLTRASMAERTIANVTVNNKTYRTIEGADIDWTTQKGWYIDLDITHGERAIRKSLGNNGYLSFVTVFPGSDTCGGNLGGAVFSLHPQKGLLDKAYVDVDGDGQVDEFQDTDNDGIPDALVPSGGGSGSGSGSNVNAFPAGDVNFDEGYSEPAMNDGVLVTIRTDENGTTTIDGDPQPRPEGRSGRLGWREIIEE